MKNSKYAYLFVAAALTACGPASPAPQMPAPQTPAPRPIDPPTHNIIPAPVSWQPQLADTFVLRPNAIIVAQGGFDVDRIARSLADLIGNTAQSTPRVLSTADTTTSRIELVLDANAPAGNE